MNILVTGGTGFIGTHIVTELIKLGHNVYVAIDEWSHEVPSGAKSIPWPSAGCLSCEALVHQSANNDTQCKDGGLMTEANFNRPLNLVKNLAARQLKCVVYASSTAVYGNYRGTAFTEEHPLGFTTPYGASKAQFEYAVKKYCEGHPSSITTTGLRYCNIYGPGEYLKGRRMSMIGQMLTKVMRREEIVLFNNGDEEREWLHVDDVVRANIKAVDLNYNGPPLNITYGVSVTFNQLVTVIREVTDMPVTVRYAPCPFPETYQSVVKTDNSLARQNLDWCPQVQLREGIEAYYTHLLAHPEQLNVKFA